MFVWIIHEISHFASELRRKHETSASLINFLIHHILSTLENGRKMCKQFIFQLHVYMFIISFTKSFLIPLRRCDVYRNLVFLCVGQQMLKLCTLFSIRKLWFTMTYNIVTRVYLLIKKLAWFQHLRHANIKKKREIKCDIMWWWQSYEISSSILLLEVNVSFSNHSLSEWKCG